LPGQSIGLERKEKGNRNRALASLPLKLGAKAIIKAKNQHSLNLLTFIFEDMGVMI
jgi:hypothetical protein